MKLSIQITSRHFFLSEAIESDLREKASKLEQFCDRITSCRVVVEIPHRRHHQGKLYNIRLNITLPGTELVVNRQPNEDIYVAIGEAFDAAGRQLDDYVRRRRGEEKTHEVAPHARVSQFYPEAGYGFLETVDGREVYFHRNSVLGGGFDRMEIGTKVRFAEEGGEEGPQASSVTSLN